MLFLLPSTQQGSDHFAFCTLTNQPSCLFFYSGGKCNNLILLQLLALTVSLLRTREKTYVNLVFGMEDLLFSNRTLGARPETNNSSQ